MVSILPTKIYSEIQDFNKSPLEQPDKTIRAGNNSKCICDGMAKVEFKIENLSFEHVFYICRDATQPILGIDFMEKSRMSINPGEMKLQIGNTVIPYHTNKSYMSKSKVALVRNFTVAPNTEVVLNAQIKSGSIQDGKTCIIEPTSTIRDTTGLMVCKVLAIPKQNLVPVRFMNLSTEPIHMYKGKVIGECEPVTSVQQFSETSIQDTKCTCICDCIPTFNKETSTSHLHCCHELNTMSAEDKYNYVWNEKLDTDVIYQSFETDKSIPEHVRQLYIDTLPRLESVRQRNRLAQMLTEYADLFAKDKEDTGKCNLVKHHIDTGDAKPIHQRCRRFAKAHIEVIRTQVAKLHRIGVIRPSTSEWASNCVVVDKKGDESKRMCIDYRPLNKVTVNPDSYLLPRIDDTLDALQGAKYFSTLDMILGYHQIELTEESKPKTAFHAPYCNPSQWEYNYMPFGLVRAPRTFQRMMDRLIQGLEYEVALCYLDDIIVFGPSIDVCMDRIDIVLTRMRNANLKLKGNKCLLFAPEVKYLGHIISAKGVSTDPAKVAAVSQWHAPKTIRQVRSFLGMINYYSRFIKNLAELAGPLNVLLHKNTKFVWNNIQQQAFEKLKERLISAPIMSYPMKKGMFILDTDASDYGYGAVLSQLQEDYNGKEQEKSIAYYSKRFTDRERKYCTRQRELLAIINAVKHFNVYLRGVTFLIRTDHASLKYIKTVKELPAQFYRWIMYLEEYSYKIEVRKGVLHANADGMSRGCHGKKCICDDLLTYERKYNIKPGTVLKEDAVEVLSFHCNIHNDEEMSKLCHKGDCMVQAFNLNPKYSTIELGKMQQKDPDIGPIYRAFEKDPTHKPKWKELSHCSKVTKSYLLDWPRLSMFGGALYRNWESANGLNVVKQLIVPRSLQLEFCHRIHDTSVAAHMGRKRTLHALLHFCYWYKMAQDVRFWIQCCDICQRRKEMQPRPKAPLQIQVSGEPCERIAMDIMGPLLKTPTGNEYVLAITDYFTKYTEAFPMPNQTAETVANVLVNKWITYKGQPLEIHTDRGANFESKLVSEVCKLYNIDKTRTTSYHPQSDGQVERYNKSISDIVRRLVKRTNEWDTVLGFSVCAYNATIHESTGFTPNRLWYGRELRYTFGSIVPDPQDPEERTYCDYVKGLQDKQRLAFDVARMALKKSAMNMKKQYDKKLNQIHYKAGERCLLKDHTKAKKGSKKFKPKYQGPYWILDKVGSVNFRIQKDENSKVEVVHHNRMRRYNIPEPIPVPDWVKKMSVHGVKFDILWPIIDEDVSTNENTKPKKTKEKSDKDTKVEEQTEKTTKPKVRRVIKKKKLNLTKKIRKVYNKTNKDTIEATTPTNTTTNEPINAAEDPTIPVRTRYGRLIKRPDRL